MLTENKNIISKYSNTVCLIGEGRRAILQMFWNGWMWWEKYDKKLLKMKLQTNITINLCNFKLLTSLNNYWMIYPIYYAVYLLYYAIYGKSTHISPLIVFSQPKHWGIKIRNYFILLRCLTRWLFWNATQYQEEVISFKAEVRVNVFKVYFYTCFLLFPRQP